MRGEERVRGSGEEVREGIEMSKRRVRRGYRVGRDGSRGWRRRGSGRGKEVPGEMEGGRRGEWLKRVGSSGRTMRNLLHCGTGDMEQKGRMASFLYTVTDSVQC